MNGAYSTPVYAMQGFLTISDREKPFSQVNYHAPAPDIEVSGAGAIGFIPDDTPKIQSNTAP